VFWVVASGAKTDRAQIRKEIATLEVGDVLMVTRLDRIARPTCDLLNTLAAITDRKAGFAPLAMQGPTPRHHMDGLCSPSWVAWLSSSGI
jgi:DNA invertase Pin-like site-specific DNA recombinase